MPDSLSALKQQNLKYEYILGALSDIGAELCKETGFDRQLKSMLHLLLGTLGSIKGGIFFLESKDSKHYLKLQCSWKLKKDTEPIFIPPEVYKNLEELPDTQTSKITDTEHFKDLPRYFDDEQLDSIAILKVRTKIIGALVVGKKLKDTELTKEEVDFLQTLSRNVAVAINNYFMLSDLRETNARLDDKIREVSILYKATQIISSELQLHALLDLALTTIGEIVKLTSGSMWLYDDETQSLNLISKITNGRVRTNPRGKIDKKTSVFVKTLLDRKSTLIKYHDAPLEVTENDQKFFGDTFALIPIMNKGTFLGAIHLENEADEPFQDRDLRLIQVFALQLGAAVQNAKLYEQAITDGMTKLYLHRYFKQRLKDEIKRASRYGHELALIMIDIDYFKKLNDTYGHQAGDEVLKQVAQILKTGLRLHDLPVRYGGEEFALLLPETGITGAKNVAQRIRKAIEASVLEYEGNIIRQTASFGIAVFPADAKDDDSIIRSADIALYYSKESGRNRVSCFKEIPEESKNGKQ
ncbi:MAG: diguanylate cyclase [Candidatus Riflebacteria bacterium]|nr:diguanylate cyclase [Candidatus Riflebacteria bacterium]